MEAFVWMFKKEDFKKHFIFVILSTIALFVLSVVFIHLLGFVELPGILNLYKNYIYLPIAFLPIFLPLGYFWDLTENIIYRKSTVQMNNVYDGKFKKIYNINLPSLNIFKLIWRGFASIVANIIMIIPYLIIIFISAFAGVLRQVSPVLIITFLIMFWLLVPPLLWNYAKQNSVTAVLNIFVAINIIANHTLRYIKMIFLFILAGIINYALDVYFAKLISTNISAPLNIVLIFFIIVSIILRYFYFNYVYAYILGTLMEEENDW